MKSFLNLVAIFLTILCSCQTSQKHIAFGTGKWKETVDISSTRNYVSSEKTSSTEITANSLDQEKEFSTLGIANQSENLDSCNFKTINIELDIAEKVIKQSEVSKSLEDLPSIEKLAIKRAIKPIIKKFKHVNTSSNYSESRLTDEEFIITFILLLFLGFLGIHRFYLGYPLYGLLMLFTAGGCGILIIIDLVLLLTGNLKQRHGYF